MLDRAETAQDGGRHERRIGDGRQRDEPDVTAFGLKRRGHMKREARLAHAAGPGDGHQARRRIIEHRPESRRLAVATEQRRELDGQGQPLPGQGRGHRPNLPRGQRYT